MVCVEDPDFDKHQEDNTATWYVFPADGARYLLTIRLDNIEIAEPNLTVSIDNPFTKVRQTKSVSTSRPDF